jgi:hypothetical protein
MGEIEGKVTDETGQGIIAAAVVMTDTNGKNTGHGATTDYDGNYLIANIEAGKYTLKVTSIGFKKSNCQSGYRCGGKKYRPRLQTCHLKKALNEVVVSGMSYKSLASEMVSHKRSKRRFKPTQLLPKQHHCHLRRSAQTLKFILI